jgi:DNA-binding MarR family transcriptional regulator
MILAIFLGHLVRVLHWCTDQAMTAALEKMELTAAQGRIMGYLSHQTEPPCPKDIEEAFHLSHPTVSGLLSRLEQKGFLELKTDPDDRRCKRIYILPKGWECHQRMHRVIADNEARILEGFSPEEREQFAVFLDRAIRNMGESPCQRKHTNKEEGNP